MKEWIELLLPDERQKSPLQLTQQKMILFTSHKNIAAPFVNTNRRALRKKVKPSVVS